MMAIRCLHATGAALLAAGLLSPGAMTLAADEAETESNEQDAIDEIIVYANRDGDPLNVDARYDELLRSRILKDYDRMQEEQAEEEWRKSLRTTTQGPSRIKWGYDAQAESRMRRETDLAGLLTDSPQPATLFRIGF